MREVTGYGNAAQPVANSVFGNLAGAERPPTASEAGSARAASSKPLRVAAHDDDERPEPQQKGASGSWPNDTQRSAEEMKARSARAEIFWGPCCPQNITAY